MEPPPRPQAPRRARHLDPPERAAILAAMEAALANADDGLEDGVVDGGVAVGVTGTLEHPKTKASDCDLVLFVSCREEIQLQPVRDAEVSPHPILRPGVSVRIGLDKNTRLKDVFARYVDVCNEVTSDYIVSVSDLEFVHCQLLQGHETAELSALMKNDKIYVRNVQTRQREALNERRRLHRDSDREYFRHLRQLLQLQTGADVVLDCQGKLLHNDQVQQVLSTTLKAHSLFIKKRCKWLKHKLEQAEREQDRASSRRAVVTIPHVEPVAQDTSVDEEDDSPEERTSRRSGRPSDADEEDDGIEGLPYPVARDETLRAGGAAQIENDDEDDESEKPSNRDFVISSSRQQPPSDDNMLWVTIPNYSPEPVRLLLEYIYTNRVIALGHDAFVQACRTKPDHKHHGPVPPFQSSSSSCRWPRAGKPTISFSVALAAIALAEEASLHRLALMCEIAASQMVTKANLVQALTLCTTQKQATGNALPRLRKAAMDLVFSSGASGVVDLGRTPTFKRAMNEQSSLLVPALLVGTMEAVTSVKSTKDHHHHSKKRDSSAMMQQYFDDLDKQDSFKREVERRKRRIERWENDPRHPNAEVEEDDEDTLETAALSWGESVLARRTLKRMSLHKLAAVRGRHSNYRSKRS